MQGKLAKYCHRPAQEPGCPPSAVQSKPAGNGENNCPQEPGCSPAALQGKPAGNGGACSQEPASLPVCREEGVLARVVCLQEQVDPRRVAPQGDLQSHCLEVVWCDSLSWDGEKKQG